MKYNLTNEQIENIGRNPYLTDRERRVYKLFYRRGWSIERIAAELEVSRSTIVRDLRKIRENK